MNYKRNLHCFADSVFVWHIKTHRPKTDGVKERTILTELCPFSCRSYEGRS